MHRVVRIALVVFGLAFAVYLIRSHPMFVGTLFLIAFSTAAFKTAYKRFRQVKLPSRFAVIRVLRKCRPLILPPTISVALYLLAFGLLPLIVTLVFVNPKDDHWYKAIGTFAAACVFLGTMIEWAVRWHRARLLEHYPKSTAFVLTAISGVAYFIATDFAKNLTHQIAGINPADFSDFVRFATVLFFLVGLTVVISVILTAVFALQSVLILLAGFMFPLGGMFASLLPLHIQKRNKGLWNRLLTGKRARAKQSWSDRAVEHFEFFISPLGTVLVAGALLTATVWLYEQAGKSVITNRKLQELIVKMEFHSNHRCDKVPPMNPVAYLSGGFVAVAQKRESGYTFSKQKCGDT
jgi:hypothetical protein